ncbi:MAG TPA: undecaprenyl-diphosphate phosphatase [Bacteroidia bacterium]|nr:undecaprenyl-diphosphate phosphatase [Bacteroidia bacterium]
MNLIQAIILGIVEGITEFLPISSTGHMIIVSSFMGIADDPFTKAFTVAIQFGAILSVLVLYWKRFLQSFNFYVKLLIAFLPAAVIGLACNKLIDRMLGNVLVVGFSLLIGGIILLFVDKWFAKTENGEDKEITNLMALKIGFFQVISMIPGVSRSAATIIGGLSQKLNRKTAIEFSFFLAVPTMFAATCYKVFEFYHKEHIFHREDVKLLLIGNIIAFIVAIVAIKGLISFLTKYGFKAFGYYRILAGLLVIILFYSHYHISMV